MSNMKNGFSTLSRWLGKKNKDKDTPNGKLSKSNTNLSILSTDVNETSQLEYNRITPLPAATSNAPFEQTFRITVLLPKDQLYVARLGARVPLSKLLQLVCENKLLDPEKYEFRNPVDPSQVYSCDLSIGAVGLSEVRLCHKSDPYDTYNTEEVLKLHRTSMIRDSLSSSEFSSRYSKHTAKTASPYSSTNSLNSMDSSGLNYTRTPVSPPPSLPTTAPPKIAAPPRKKRAAPRPPSQTVIPERSALVITNGHSEEQETTVVKREDSVPRRNHHMSTPNLSTSHLGGHVVDCNGNATSGDNTLNDSLNGSPEDEQVRQKNERNLCGGSVQNLSTVSPEQDHELPEPSPRKRLVVVKKKSAPAPPPRGSIYSEDNVSMGSGIPSAPGSPVITTPNLSHEGLSSPHILSSTANEVEVTNDRVKSEPESRDAAETTRSFKASTPVAETHEVVRTLNESNSSLVNEVPKPVPRITTTTLITTNTVAPEVFPDPSNVSKVMLNRTPTPEPRSLSSETTDATETTDSGVAVQISELHHKTAITDDDDVLSKQADSGIGEPVPSPIPDSLPSEGSAHECKSTFESSSDDDDMVKVYNFKLGKTLVQPLDGTSTPQEKDNSVSAVDSEKVDQTPQQTTPGYSDTSSWNFSIPISPPPNFADSKCVDGSETEEKTPDTPITPKIKERPVLNFDSVANDPSSSKLNKKTESVSTKDVDNRRKEMGSEIRDVSHQIRTMPITPLASPTTPLNEIVDELSAIINCNKMDSLIRRPEDQPDIEAAKPNTLSNFSITTIAQQPTKPMEVLCNDNRELQTAQSEVEKPRPRNGDDVDSTGHIHHSLRQRSADSNLTPPHVVPAMEPQGSAKQSERDATESGGSGLNSRSSSHLSLTKLEQNGPNLNRRRSSSELSIGESPSLQSLEVIKTILNSRKNSLNSSSDGETKPATPPIVDNLERTTQPKMEPAHNSAAPTPTKPKSNEHADSNVNANVHVSEKVTPAETPKEPKEVPKIYRYSGPPSINLSTWNERPKVQVSIKNEGDYIFGGKSAHNQSAAVTTAAMEINTSSNGLPRNYRSSTPSGTFNTNSLERRTVQRTESNASTNAKVIPPEPPLKPTSPIKRMGIPEKEFHVPITVKPLKDVTVENAKSARSTTVTTITLNVGAETELLRTETKSEMQFDSRSEPKLGQTNRPSIESVVTCRRPPSQVTIGPATLPRSNANRFSTPAEKKTSGSSLLRATSITQLEANKTKAAEKEKEAGPTPAPFGQNTLRKTGLKEKILAREERAQQEGASAIPPTIITNGNIQITSTGVQRPPPAKTLQSAKLELKLQKSTSVFVNQAIPNGDREQTTSPMAPPPPPPVTPATPMSATSVFTKNSTTKSRNSSAASTPTSCGDPRDQLLEAIRNFKREELNRT